MLIHFNRSGIFRENVELIPYQIKVETAMEVATTEINMPTC
jgi:hypothetical protein